MNAATPNPSRTATHAGTAIIFRNGAPGQGPEVLMLVRSGRMRFAPGAAVFPGGQVDPADRELAVTLAKPGMDLTELTGKIASVRETLEETGLVIGVDRPVDAAEAREARRMLEAAGSFSAVVDSFGWQLALDRLTPFARWIRPSPSRPLDVYFYLCNLGSGAVDLVADEFENDVLLWITPSAALERAERGELKLIFPTLCNLHRLAQHRSFSEAVADAQAHPVRPIHPAVAEQDGVPHLTIPKGIGYPLTALPYHLAQRG